MNKHEEAIAAFQQGNAQEALERIEELLKNAASGELWNDWATIQAALGKAREAEDGFARALELDPKNWQAKANLGLLFLGLGNHGRAIPLIEESLPHLPAANRETLRTVLAAARERALTGCESSPNTNLSILLIHDCLAQVSSPADEPQIIQIARRLRELGHKTTLIVRDGRRCGRFHSILEKFGVEIYAGDCTRMAQLGQEIPACNWSLGKLLAEQSFSFALLTEGFQHGISIPEHYLDEVRQRSPATRIVVLRETAGDNESSSQSGSSIEVSRYETAEDWSQRQRESLERADLVIAAAGRDYENSGKPEPALEFQIVALPEARRTADFVSLERVLERALQQQLKPAMAHPFSVNVVEAVFSSLLSQASGEKRVYARLDFYVQLAEQALRQGQPVFARQQLRHVFGWLGNSLRLAPALAHPLGLLARCYDQLGDAAHATQCAEEARRCFFEPAKCQSGDAPVPIERVQDQPLFSLIVPTFNRLPILKKCLAALQGQNISPALFEVIVIDDGSSDGTEDFVRGYRPVFHLQYVRQSNSGTGAARRNGVQHARGEYLLLMNDDTICDPNLLDEHIKAHQTYSPGSWAVLGNFEYPAEARRRALTYFLRDRSFMFPQVDMTDGCPYPYSHFITCNLSVRHEAVLRAGSFDSTYKLSEDTELGIRLFEMGYGVIYHSAAHAWHDHLPYHVSNLIRRARVYGADYFYMFRNHPRVMREWAMPISLEDMGERDATKLRQYLDRNRTEVEAAASAMARWDVVDFEPVLADPREAEHVLSLFQQAVPAVHWFYLFESMLETMGKKLNLPQQAQNEEIARAAQGF